jgi:hypothetical protein
LVLTAGGTHAYRRHSKIHTFLFVLLSLALAVLACVGTFFRGLAATPSGGTIAPTLGATITWNGDSLATGATGGEGQCIDSGPAKNCDSFALTVGGNPSDWTGKLIQVRAAWTSQAHDYDLYVHKGDLSGPVAASGTNGGQPATEEVAYLDPANAGVGLYTVHIAYASRNPRTGYLCGLSQSSAGLNAGATRYRRAHRSISESLSAAEFDHGGFGVWMPVNHR